MSDSNKLLVAKLHHDIYLDLETKRFFSDFKLEEIVDQPLVVFRTATLTAIINRQIGKANTVVDDTREIKQFYEAMKEENNNDSETK